MHFVIYKYACFDASRRTRAEKRGDLLGERKNKKEKQTLGTREVAPPASPPPPPLRSPLSAFSSPPLLSLSSSHLEIQAKFSLSSRYDSVTTPRQATTTTANLMYGSLQPLLGSDAYFLIASRSLQCHCLLT
jgi:hypothetical protein